MNIAIIGGGAAGMMVAATLCERNLKAVIHIFEKNPSLGKKVLISGGGRCNVTTGYTDTHLVESKYVRGSLFLRPAMAAFGPEKVFQWFEAHGVPLKNEEDFRVFPRSDQGKDVVTVFEKLFAKYDVQVHFSEPVTAIVKQGDGRFELVTAKRSEMMDVVVITTGGNAYRHTGSTGDGYDFAKACGHTITQLGPSLNSFEVKETWCKELSGISLPAASLVGVDPKTEVITGPFLFTHFGISGPMVFAFSAHIPFATITPQHPLSVRLYPLGYNNFDYWEHALLSLFHQNTAKSVANILRTLLPKRLVAELLLLSGISESHTCHQLPKALRRKLVHLLSGELRLTLLARRPGDEFVTAGGVCLDEVNRKTLESKCCPNLYFGGEVLDVDGVTGGFNLQVAWATGRLVGETIAKKLKVES
jgi:predicted Rossmann fold flavoprotein